MKCPKCNSTHIIVVEWEIQHQNVIYKDNEPIDFNHAEITNSGFDHDAPTSCYDCQYEAKYTEFAERSDCSPSTLQIKHNTHYWHPTTGWTEFTKETP